MTVQEAMNEITTKFKWYVIFKNNKSRLKKESHLRVTALRILNGTAKTASMKVFFKHFGYEYTSVVTKKI